MKNGYGILKLKYTKVFLVISSLLILSGCGLVPIPKSANLSSTPCNNIKCDVANLYNNTASIYAPDGVQIVAVDEQYFGNGITFFSADPRYGYYAYVDPGVRLVEVSRVWGDTKYKNAMRLNVKKGRGYKITFDKPSVSFVYEETDMPKPF